MSNKDIDGLIQKAISMCIDDGEYDPVEDWIVDPALRLCNEALGEAAGELETLRSETARLVAELARVEKERDKAERTHAQQLRWQGDEWQFTLDAMTTRAKSAEERCERLATVAACLRSSQHYSRTGGGADAGRYLADAFRSLEVCESHGDIEPLALTTPGDAGKGET